MKPAGGHKCAKRCHAYDPQHTEVICLQPCQRRCGNDEYRHPCKKLCHMVGLVNYFINSFIFNSTIISLQQCGKCSATVSKLLPCAHTQNVLCPTAVSLVKCTSPCARTIAACGHACKLRCFETCEHGKCRVKVRRALPCGHTIEVECGKKDVANVKCTEKVVIGLRIKKSVTLFR